LKQHTRLIILLALFGIGGCENPDRNWEIAERDDTPTAYLEYLAKYPESEFAELARLRIEALKESRGWERTQFRNTLAGYTAFIEKFPDSAFVADAQTRIAEIRRDDRWAVAQDAGSAAVIETFIRDYPDAPQIDQARDLLATYATLEASKKPEIPVEPPGNFRLQLASFRTARAADTELRRLVELLPNSLPRPIKIHTPGIDDTNPMYVLKSVPMTRDEAQGVCAKLAAKKQVCLIINR
jgi:hypothetical protein